LVLLKQATGITFLLIGDNKQLPPVEDETIEDYFNHPAVHYLTNSNRNILTVKKRFDNRLYEYLKNVDGLDTSSFDVKETQRNLCYYNRTRKHINKLWNDKLKPADSLLIKADDTDEYTQDMYIYKDLPVIARKTANKGDVCMNNETFEVLDYDDNNIYLGTTRPNDDGEAECHSIEVEIKDFNELFCLNYCSTTHKAQGETITDDFTIYDWDRMDTKCRYTALSRARNPEQVSFGKVDLPFEPETFESNIKRKITGHLKYDKQKKLESNITVEKVKILFEKQNGACNICGCDMKTTHYKSNDGKQFSIDRINPLWGHTDDNIQLLCWNCNRGKSNRF
jgi:ATP-dependent exoDNAse (exonuclease V) alpha subunit